MDRRSFLSRQVVIAGAGVATALGASAGQAQAASRGAFIAIPITAKAGKSDEEVLNAMRPIIELIRREPGLLDEVLVKSLFPNNEPTHMHIMRWRKMSNWEGLFEKPEILAAIDASGDIFSLKAAEVFTQVRV